MEKELKTKMLGLQKKTVKDLGKDTDVLIASFNEGHCGCVMRGASQNIAHSIFALIHDPKNSMGNDLYRVIKLVVLNIVNNESPYAMDLLTSILNTPAPIEQNEKPNHGKKAMLVKMPIKNEQK